MKIPTWVGLITGLAIVGAVATKDLWKKEELGGPFERPTNVTEIFNQTYPLTLRYENGEKSKEKFRLTIELDREDKTLYLGNYTQHYNKQNWTGKLENVPAYAKHTGISPFSKTILIHPREVRVSGLDQKIYLVPQYGWDQKTKPYEKHEEAQKLIHGGEKIIDAITGEIPIPFFKDFFGAWIKSAKRKEREKIKDLIGKIKKRRYTATVIPSHIKDKLMGSVETAREYLIGLDTSQLKRKAPIYLATKIILGDPTKASSGSFPNKYGELETKVVEFSLGKEEIKPAKKIEKGKKVKVPSQKSFQICIYHDPKVHRRIDGRSAIDEVIFYMKKENESWMEFNRSQSACAKKPIILENRNSIIEIRARGFYSNGRGQKWLYNFGSSSKDEVVSKDTKTKRITLYGGRETPGVPYGKKIENGQLIENY